jgi:hypothetical protein
MEGCNKGDTLMKKVYLAGPYNHKVRAMRVYRFETICRITKTVMLAGNIVFSFWKEQDLSFVNWCDELWIVMLPGWQKSVGVTEEIQEAIRLGKKIVYLEPDHE